VAEAPLIRRFDSRYRRLSVAAMTAETRQGQDGLRLQGADGRSLWLAVDDAALAQLFDGQRDPAARLAAAREQLAEPQLQGSALEALAAALAAQGLLQPGRDEPLPVPPNHHREAVMLGWAGPAAAIPLPVVLPASLAGSRAKPGYPAGLVGTRVGDGRDSTLDWPLDPAAAVALGRLLLAPLAHSLGRTVASLLLLALVYGLWQQRDLFVLHGQQHLQSLAVLWGLPLAILLVNLVSQSARAAAVLDLSFERPRFGLAWGFPPLPHFWVDTRGAPERARRAVRTQILLAPLKASAVLLGLALFAFLLAARTAPGLAGFLVLLTLTLLLSLAIRLNPAARFEGYALLAQRLGISDLKQQSFFALFNFRRPWAQGRAGPSLALLRAYAVLSGLLLLGVATFLLSLTAPLIIAWAGGIGFLFIAGYLGVYMYKQLGRPALPRDGLGTTPTWQKLRDWRPNRRQKWILGLVLLAALFPYRYAPSGDLEVLPLARADARALMAGDIRKVHVAEGDTVSAGQVLAQLADEEPRARIAASEATLAQLRADLALLERGAREEEIEVARSRVATLSKKAEFSRATEQRLARARRDGGASVEEYERARGTAEVDAQQLLEAERALDLLTSPARDERVTALKAQVTREEALLAFHRVQLEQTQIRAPIAGRVTGEGLQFAVGRYLERGEVLARVEDVAERLAEIRLPESAVGEIEVGRAATARVWAYPGTGFRGTVRSIAPVAEPGRFGQVVRVQIAVEDPEDRLKSGMTGAGKARGGWYPAIVVFTRALARFFLVEVWSWLP
jgi:putative peptide zinc metalloprotease protein